MGNIRERVKVKPPVGNFLKDFKVLVILHDKSDSTRFFLTSFIVRKNYELNAVIKVAQQSKFLERLSWPEVVAAMRLFRQSTVTGTKGMEGGNDNTAKIDRAGFDMVVTTIKGFSRDAHYYELFNPRNENEMILRYQECYRGVRFAGNVPQQMKNGGCVYLDEDKSRRAFRINYTEIKMPTLAAMFAIDAVNMRSVDELLLSIAAMS